MNLTIIQKKHFEFKLKISIFYDTIFFITKFQSTLLPFITKESSEKETVFILENPPKVGFYKLQIFGCKKPKRPGKLRIPLIANFLLDFRHTVGTEDVNDTVMAAAAELMSKSNNPELTSGNGLFLNRALSLVTF